MNSFVETKQIICNTCLKVKVAFQDGTFGTSRNKRWRDINGKMFNGRKCPECQVDIVKKNMQKLRTK